MRAVIGTGSDKAREVRLGRFTAGARTLVRDRDVLVAETARLQEDNARLWPITEKVT
jgi:hypothetical protein